MSQRPWWNKLSFDLFKRADCLATLIFDLAEAREFSFRWRPRGRWSPRRYDIVHTNTNWSKHPCKRAVASIGSFYGLHWGRVKGFLLVQTIVFEAHMGSSSCVSFTERWGLHRKRPIECMCPLSVSLGEECLLYRAHLQLQRAGVHTLNL